MHTSLDCCSRAHQNMRARRDWTLEPTHKLFEACMDSLLQGANMDAIDAMHTYVHEWFKWIMIDPYPWKHYNILVDWHIFKVNIKFNLSRSHLEWCPVLTMTPELCLVPHLLYANFNLKKILLSILKFY